MQSDEDSIVGLWVYTLETVVQRALACVSSLLRGTHLFRLIKSGMKNPGRAAWFIPSTMCWMTRAIHVFQGGQDRQYDGNSAMLEWGDNVVLPVVFAATAASLNEIQHEELGTEIGPPVHQQNWFFLAFTSLGIGFISGVEAWFVHTGHRSKRDSLSPTSVWHTALTGWWLAWLTVSAVEMLHSNPRSRWTWLAIFALIGGFGGAALYDFLPVFGKAKRKISI